jgi:hypothetical protein
MIDLQKATELAPGLLNAHYHLGLAHYFQGRFKQWLKTDLLPDKKDTFIWS